MSIKSFSLDCESLAGYLPTMTIEVSDSSLVFKRENGNWYRTSGTRANPGSGYSLHLLSRALTDTDDESVKNGIFCETRYTVRFWRGHAFVDVDIAAVDFDNYTNLSQVASVITDNALRVINAFKTKYSAIKHSHTASFSG